MNKSTPVVLAAFALSSVAAAQAPLSGAVTSGSVQSSMVRPDAVLLRMPDVSASEVVFRYANDLWLAPKAGGVARALASPDGEESFPKFSPDGKRIAFVAGYDGGVDLYVLDIDAGVPQRVTYHPSSEVLCDWHPDGESLIYFSSQESGQQRAPRLFKVSAGGGPSEALPVPYGVFGALDATGSWLAYTPTAASEFRTWKRYQGGLAQDVWLFNLTTLEARRVTDHPGTDALPLWSGSDLYFLSDRDSNARMNLWAYDTQRKVTTQVTDFVEDDVRFPSVGPEDIVFENGGKLLRYEFASGRTHRIEIAIPGERPSLRPQSLPLAKMVDWAVPGPNAKRVVVEARGEVFSAPVEEGVTRNLTRTDGVAERYPSWSPDGKWIAYWSDASGEYELYVRSGDGAPFRWPGDSEDVRERRLTSIGPMWKYGASWAPDSRSLVFCNNAGELWRLVLESGELTKLATDPDGQPFNVDWSPDSRWIAFSMRSTRSRLGAIWLLDTRDGVLREATSGLYDDRDPSFDRDGEWLYFVSTRTFEPTYSGVDETWIYANGANLVALPLRKDVENPFATADASEVEETPSDDKDEDEDAQKDGEPKDGDEAKEAKSEASKSDDAATEQGEPAESVAAADGAKKAEKSPKPVEIEFEGIEARALVLPVDAGALDAPAGGASKVFYLRRARAGSGGVDSTLMQFTLSSKRKERVEKTVVGGVRGFVLAAKAEKALVRLADGGWAVVETKPDQKVEGKLDLSGLEMLVDPRREWNQILGDAHRIMRDFFYEPTLHGVDWNGLRERYARALADATHRSDLHYLLGEMISELNVGHAYNRGPSDDGGSARGALAGSLGCDFALEQGAYRITRILGFESPEADARSPLAQHGIDARPGDWLLAVNGRAVDPRRDVHAALLGSVGKPTELLLNAAPTFDGAERRVVVTPLDSDAGLRYRDWVAARRTQVDELSGGRVGYVHVPDTGIRGQNELVRQLQSQMDKDALLVDERWNGGGQIPTRFIELLNRPRTNFWAVRHGEDWSWPPRTHHGPKAMLINGSSGSGGDAFPYYFRQANLGKLIGQRTWGGLVGISGNPAFIDGASITVPRFAFYEKDGTWGVEGYGVAPDIEVLDDPSLMAHGEDPQLVAGVQHLLRELESFTFERAQRPPSPDRRGSGVTPADR
jgi:tricorn protease